MSPSPKRPAPIKYGSQAKTPAQKKAQKKVQKAPERPKGPGVLELLARYVIVAHRGVERPCPSIEQAQSYAEQHATRRHPVIVKQYRHGKATILAVYPKRK